MKKYTLNDIIQLICIIIFDAFIIFYLDKAPLNNIQLCLFTIVLTIICIISFDKIEHTLDNYYMSIIATYKSLLYPVLDILSILACGCFISPVLFGIFGGILLLYFVYKYYSLYKKWNTIDKTRYKNTKDVRLW